MFNKGSCRNCGMELTPLSICVTCREHVSWLCDGCGRSDDVPHVHAGFKYQVIE